DEGEQQDRVEGRAEADLPGLEPRRAGGEPEHDPDTAEPSQPESDEARVRSKRLPGAQAGERVGRLTADARKERARGPDDHDRRDQDEDEPKGTDQTKDRRDREPGVDLAEQGESAAVEEEGDQEEQGTGQDQERRGIEERGREADARAGGDAKEPGPVLLAPGGRRCCHASVLRRLGLHGLPSYLRLGREISAGAVRAAATDLGRLRSNDELDLGPRPGPLVLPGVSLVDLAVGNDRADLLLFALPPQPVGKPMVDDSGRNDGGVESHARHGPGGKRPNLHPTLRTCRSTDLDGGIPDARPRLSEDPAARSQASRPRPLLDLFEPPLDLALTVRPGPTEGGDMDARRLLQHKVRGHGSALLTHERTPHS